MVDKKNKSDFNKKLIQKFSPEKCPVEVAGKRAHAREDLQKK